MGLTAVTDLSLGGNLIISPMWTYRSYETPLTLWVVFRCSVLQFQQ